jgi:hypothetical protein
VISLIKKFNITNTKIQEIDRPKHIPRILYEQFDDKHIQEGNNIVKKTLDKRYLERLDNDQ